jgi:parvulin-like peptidyl-prolyl isomerase
MQKALDEFETNLETEAKEKKYASAAAYLEEVVGPGVTVENYKEFLRQNYLAFTYLEQMAENKDVTTDEINAYYAEHEKDYKTQKESKSLVYHVRHILLFPGGTEKKEYTEADWTKGLADAEAMLQQWRDGEATEESFAELAKKHSGDSNAADGGLYEALTSGTNFVKEFKDWYMDENRQVGDTGIVKTTYGYHLMYFSGMEEEWVYNIRNQILKDYQDELVKLSVDKHPAQITYSNVVLGTLNLK